MDTHSQRSIVMLQARPGCTDCLTFLWAWVPWISQCKQGRLICMHIWLCRRCNSLQHLSFIFDDFLLSVQCLWILLEQSVHDWELRWFHLRPTAQTLNVAILHHYAAVVYISFCLFGMKRLSVSDSWWDNSLWDTVPNMLVVFELIGGCSAQA